MTTENRKSWPMHDLPACSGACSQGRGRCQTPDACRLHLEDEDGDPVRGVEAAKVFASMFGLPAVVFIAAMVAVFWGA